MKLPEYDNRPQVGQKLYSDSSKSDWEDIKYPLQVLGLAAAGLVSIAGVLYGLISLIFN